MKKHFGEILLGAFLITLLTGGVLLMRAYKQPLAPPLTLNVQAAAPEEVAAKQPVQENKVCGMSGSMTVMVVGRDDEGIWVPPYGADAVRFVRVDFNHSEINIFDFHRDSLLDTPSLEVPYDLAESELGEIYLTVTSKVTNPADDPLKADVDATNAVAQTIFDNFQVKPDHYMTLQEDVLWDVIDILDGITVVVPEEVTIEDVTIPAGSQTFDGKTAELYMRYLPSTEAAWTRTDRQNVVLLGLRDKMTQPAVVAKIPELYQEFKDKVITDLSFEEMSALICMAGEVPLEEVAHSSIPRTMVTVKDAEGVIIINDLNEAKQLVKKELKQ